MYENYEMVIGLEVHVEMKTASKMFCGCTTEFGGAPNTHVCPICMGLPGTLPVLNKKAVDFAIQTALALECRVTPFSQFSRKNYFYPDLPKAYQISQYDLPLAVNGRIHVTTGDVTESIRINRVHLEEDAGKLIHIGTISTSPYSMVDYNRSGVPLMEIVSEPDIRSPEQAKAYLDKLKAILQFIHVSDCKMEEGSLRCDANISIRTKGSDTYGTKVEIKNLNSFKAVGKAIEFEAHRQYDLIANGTRLIQETRTWDEAQGVTLSLRSKEEAHDYRYFPEPDLVPIVVDEDWVRSQQELLPELPDARKARFMSAYHLSTYDAELMIASPAVGSFFDEVMKLYPDGKTVVNWINGDLMRCLNEAGMTMEDNPLTPTQLSGMLMLIDSGTISGKIAKTVFAEMFSSGKQADVIVKEKGLIQITDSTFIEEVVDEVIRSNPQTLADYLAGKDKAMDFFIGQVMRTTKGKANPAIVTEILQGKLEKVKEDIEK